MGTARWFASGMRLAPIAPPALVDALLEREPTDSLNAAPLTSMPMAANGDDDEVEDDAEDGAEEPSFAVAEGRNGFALPRGGLDLKDHLSAIELGLIRKALEESHGTVAEAARLLRMRRTTLVEKLRKYRLSA